MQDAQKKTPEGWHRHANGGGLVEDTAKVYQDAYVGRNARVSGRAEVYGDARVSGRAEVYGDARVYGRALVSGVPKVLTGFPHIVTITDHHIRAGCEQHPPSVWRERGAAIIKADGYDSKTAKAWAQIINLIAEQHGCTDMEASK
jgi:carbonic anhydrase/acetyltransferase-like protein (isoleucine patch superfamily)